MKIIVGGAGSVGKSIVAYLSRGNNDVAVVDEDERKLNEVAREWDVMPVLGSVAHPDVLQKAEAGKSDLLIAATESDEVNMIACQAAYSLFNVPRKVARISARVYHKAAWGGLFGDHDIPVDLAVSPEYEIAGAIKRVLQFPGISGICPFAGKKLMLLSFRCPKKSPLLQIPLDHLERAEPDLHIAVVNVIHSGRGFIPGSDDTFHAGDEINLLAAADEVEDVIRAFGLERKDNERVLIFGGDQIAEYLAEALEEDDGIAGCRVIDEDPRSAARLAEHLNNTAVFNGSVMSDVVLAEAGIADADAAVAVTGEDKDNIIAAMIARKNGVENTFALVNSRSANTQMINVGENILIDRTTITISAILKELRKVRLNNACTLGLSGEVWEIAVDGNSTLIGSTFAQLGLPEESRVCALIRKGETRFLPAADEQVEEGDVLVFFVAPSSIRRAEKIFA